MGDDDNMAEHPERGISESELIEEIKEALRDIRDICDKEKLYGDGGEENVEEDVAGVGLYAERINAVHHCSKLLEMAEKYFHKGDWQKYDLRPSVKGHIHSPRELIDALASKEYFSYPSFNINSDIISF